MVERGAGGFLGMGKKEGVGERWGGNGRKEGGLVMRFGFGFRDSVQMMDI